MVKPEWGDKRTCPKCATRFYDLGNAEPVTCINCGTQWVPDPVLKSKQPMSFEAAAKPDAAAEPAADALAEDEIDLEADTEAGRADADVDIGGDEDLDAVVTTEDEPDER